MGHPLKKRSIWIEGAVAHVPLTKGYVAILDAADAHLVDGKNWQAGGTKKYVYAVHSFRQDGRTITVSMHRVLMGGTASAEQVVDHISGNTLDNRRANLRLCLNRNNQANRHAVLSKYGYKGLNFLPGVGRPRNLFWRASLCSDGKRIHSRMCATPEEAAAAYDELAERHFGEFAMTNRKLGLLK